MSSTAKSSLACLAVRRRKTQFPTSRSQRKKVSGDDCSVARYSTGQHVQLLPRKSLSVLLMVPPDFANITQLPSDRTIIAIEHVRVNVLCALIAGGFGRGEFPQLAMPGA